MKVNEIFESFQFEGTRSGTLNTFIRFSGCNRKCSFCDTQHSQYYEIEPHKIVQEVKTNNVILTGGEPLFQPQDELLELVELLQEESRYVAMETNGDLIKKTDARILADIDWITCSPKIKLDLAILNNVDELKYIIPDCIDYIDWKYENSIFLQPRWDRWAEDQVREKILEQTMELVKQHPKARLSIQTHKYLGIK